MCAKLKIVFFFLRRGCHFENRKWETEHSISSTSCPNKPTLSKRSNMTKLVKRWYCDVCKVASFTTFEEAFDHEEACGGKQQQINSRSIETTRTTTRTSTVNQKASQSNSTSV
jgi:hypothetical protein